MAHPNSHLREKFSNAVEILATRPGDARARLADAHSAFFAISPDQLPSDLQDDFRALMSRLSKYPPRHRHEGRLAASVARMTNNTAVRLTKTIWRIYLTLESG